MTDSPDRRTATEQSDYGCVDVSGLPCPQPVAVVRRKLSGLDDGERLVVEGADRATAASIRRACERHGFDVTGDGETLVIRSTALASL